MRNECPSLRDALAEFLAVKSRSGLREGYITGLRQYLSAFVRGREMTPICMVAPVELEEWFSSRGESPAAEASNRGRLSSLFSFAIRRGWMTEDPVKRLEPIRIQRRPPEILTVDECRHALTWTRDNAPAFLRILVCMLLLGIRPHEARRLGPEAFRGDVVVVDSAASKVHRRRIIEPHPTAAAWLAICGPVVPLSAATVRRWMRRMRIALGRATWPQDALRHSFVSYSLAAGRDIGSLAEQAGNSPRMILQHYRALVTRADAEAFWSILP